MSRKSSKYRVMFLLILNMEWKNAIVLSSNNVSLVNLLSQHTIFLFPWTVSEDHTHTREVFFSRRKGNSEKKLINDVIFLKKSRNEWSKDPNKNRSEKQKRGNKYMNIYIYSKGSSVQVAKYFVINENMYKKERKEWKTNNISKWELLKNEDGD